MILLKRVQDSLGRTSELAGVIDAEAEILWDLQDPAYVEVLAERDNLVLAKGDKITGWVVSETELSGDGGAWDSPLLLRGSGSVPARREGAGTDSLLCSPVMIHLAADRDIGPRFVSRCAAYSAGRA